MCFLHGIPFFLNSWKTPRKLSITNNGLSNVARATLFKLLSVVDILLRIPQKFRNIFLKKQLRKAVLAAFHQIKIKGCNLKSLFQFSEDSLDS